MGYYIALGCEGVPDGGIQGNVCRCHNCEVDGTTGLFVVPDEWEEKLRVAMSHPFGSRAVLQIINEMGDVVDIPRCPRGAVRFLTTTITTVNG